MKLRLAVVAWGLVLACAGSIVPAHAAHLPQGTAVHVRLKADLVSAHAAVGARVDMEVSQPVMLQGVVVIPAGTVAWGAVQTVKIGKSLHFDVEGLRMPNEEVVKLRVSAQKTTNAARDEIKIETHVGADVGAPQGAEYSAYLDQDVNTDAVAAPAAPALTPAEPQPAAPAPTETPASPEPAAPVPTPAPAPTPEAPPQVLAPPVASTPTPAVHSAAAVQPGELITVECFSEPTGAEIIIDDEFHGSTPSILKIAPGNHQIEYRLMGYQSRSQPLNLTPGTGLRTVRMNLEKLP